MKLYDIEHKFAETRKKYNRIANTIKCKCINSKSFYRAMSALRNYTVFVNVVGAEYFDSIAEDMCAMGEHIEELAQGLEEE